MNPSNPPASSPTAGPCSADQWQWFGHAGHYICASRCLFHLCTRVGDYLVSSVGDLYLDRNGDQLGPRSNVGAGRLFETYVFNVIPNAKACDCGCGLPEVDRSEIDALPAQSGAEANANHMELCRKYAALTLATGGKP